MTSRPNHVVFFDRDCLLCNRAVKFLMVRDKRGVLRFAPLQGPTAAALIARCPAVASGLDEPGTIVLSMAHDTPEERIYLKSSAVARLLRQCTGPWPLLGRLLDAIPAPLRDWGYGLVARNRYRWFGRATTASCPMPAPDEARHLLP